MSARSLCLLGALLLVACSSDEEEQAKEKCRTLVADWCSAVLDCFLETGDLAESERDAELDACRKNGERAVECSSAVGVSDDYDDCLSDVHSVSCSSLDLSSPALPHSCNRVIEVPE